MAITLTNTACTCAGQSCLSSSSYVSDSRTLCWLLRLCVYVYTLCPKFPFCYLSLKMLLR